MRLMSLYKHPFFIGGLFIRLMLVLFVMPFIRIEWFIPFFENSLLFPQLDPWTSFLNHGGNSIAFPYGTAMYLAFLPGILLGAGFTWIAGLNATSFGIGMVILVLDVVLLSTIKLISKTSGSRVLLYYWLSPIVIYICYWHGQMDILPVTLLMLGLYFLEVERPAFSGIMVALSVSAKLSMVLAVPILLVFLWQNNQVRWQFRRFVIYFLLVFAVIQLPYFFSSSFVQMVFSNPELKKIGLLSISFDHRHLYVLPMVYSLFLYLLWRFKRMSYELLCVLLGISFFIVLLMTPASIGWYFWIVPFLVLHQVKSTSFLENTFVFCFSCLFVLCGFLYQTGVFIPFLKLNLSEPLIKQWEMLSHLPIDFYSWILTLLSVLLGVLCLNMYIKGVRYNDYFRLSRKPLAIGIAGDSGSGKDTLSSAIAGLFNLDTVTTLHGDDYHRWDRYTPMWKVLTHLDPRANKLHQMLKDFMGLMDGKSIISRHYNHQTGRFTQSLSVKRNDVIIVNGLHTLYVPALATNLDVKIFLKMDESLRQYFKIRRDVFERGHSEKKVRESIERRISDAITYLYPQADSADIVFSLEPVDKRMLNDYTQMVDLKLRLRVVIRNAFYYEDMARYLVGLCGMWVDVSFSSETAHIELMVDGDVKADDIAMILKKMVPTVGTLLSFKPVWKGGMIGIMQLVVLLHTIEVLRKRLV